MIKTLRATTALLACAHLAVPGPALARSAATRQEVPCATAAGSGVCTAAAGWGGEAAGIRLAQSDGGGGGGSGGGGGGSDSGGGDSGGGSSAGGGSDSGGSDSGDSDSGGSDGGDSGGGSSDSGGSDGGSSDGGGSVGGSTAGGSGSGGASGGGSASGSTSTDTSTGSSAGGGSDEGSSAGGSSNASSSDGGGSDAGSSGGGSAGGSVSGGASGGSAASGSTSTDTSGGTSSGSNGSTGSTSGGSTSGSTGSAGTGASGSTSGGTSGGSASGDTTSGDATSGGAATGGTSAGGTSGSSTPSDTASGDGTSSGSGAGEDPSDGGTAGATTSGDGTSGESSSGATGSGNASGGDGASGTAAGGGASGTSGGSASDGASSGTTAGSAPASGSGVSSGGGGTTASEEAALEGRSPEAAAARDDAEPVESRERTVTEETARSSSENFDSAITQANSDVAEGVEAEETQSRLRELLVGAGSLAVGSMLSGNRRVVAASPDRLVVSRGSDDYEIIKDDNALLDRPGARVTTQTFADGSSRTVVRYPDGSEIVTIRDADLRVVQRVRVTSEGERIVLIDDLDREVQPVDVEELRGTEAPAEEVDISDEEALRRALGVLPEIDRPYSLNQVRSVEEVRGQVPGVDLEAITFESGSAAIRPEQAEALRDLGLFIREQIEASPRAVFLVEGHTDAVGEAPYNLALSDRRAESVALALGEYFDVPTENLVVQGYGERFLKVDSEGAERANRRATVRNITPLLQVAGMDADME